jgi:hypothetical protein
VIDDDGKMMILTDKTMYNPNIYDNENLSLVHHRRAFLHNIFIRGSVINNRDEFIEDVKKYFL